MPDAPLQLINGVNLFIFIFVRLREMSGDTQPAVLFIFSFLLPLSVFVSRRLKLSQGKKKHRDDELTDHRGKSKEMEHHVTLNST